MASQNEDENRRINFADAHKRQETEGKSSEQA